MTKLLIFVIPNPCFYFVLAVLASSVIRVYISFVEAWTKGWNYFFPILFGYGLPDPTDNTKIVAADRLTGFVIGIFECSIYPLLMKLEMPEYIGAWLVFKTVNRWSYKVQDRGIFNRYLVGNGLALFASYLLARFAL